MKILDQLMLAPGTSTGKGPASYCLYPGSYSSSSYLSSNPVASYGSYRYGTGYLGTRV